MDEDTCILVAVVVGILALAAVIITPIWLAWSHGTQRLEDCVSNGGSYVKVENDSTYECVMP